MGKSTRILFLCFLSFNVFGKSASFDLWNFNFISDQPATVPSLTTSALKNINTVDPDEISLNDIHWSAKNDFKHLKIHKININEVNDTREVKLPKQKSFRDITTPEAKVLIYDID